jgi:hypothetical protein
VVVVLLAALVARTGGGQVVRGTVTERASGSPIAGALVTLESVASSGPPAAALTNARGEYAVVAPPGRYRLSAKRIGAQRFISETFDLASGETRRMDIVLESLAQILPVVRIADSDLCVRREDQRQRVNSLWDEARTALTAARISLRDKLFEGQLTRYTRGLDPRNLRVLEESYAEQQGLMDRPFVSPSGDSLSKMGYRRTVDSYEYYYAPDADVLVSAAFRRDHCFSVVEGSRDRSGMVGIAFEPVASRTLPDVAGTLWLDGRTFELRLVEFRYTQLEPFQGSDRVGGEVHFGRLDSGAWVTSRFFLRIPQFARPVAPVDNYTRTPSVVVRPTMHRLIEEGGIVFTKGLKHFARPASVAGVVTDSTGRPMAGSLVRLGGTPFRTTAGEDGRYLLDSLPAGRFTVIVEHPSYAEAGSFVTDVPVDLREGVTLSRDVLAPRTSELVERLCDGKLPAKDNGTARIIVTDRDTSRPLAHLRVWLRWAGRFTGSDEHMTASVRGGLETMTDAAGTVVFCDVPGDVRMVFSAVRPDGKAAADSTEVRVPKNGLQVWRVTTVRPQ